MPTGAKSKIFKVCAFKMPFPAFRDHSQWEIVAFQEKVVARAYWSPSHQCITEPKIMAGSCLVAKTQQRIVLKKTG